MNKQGKRTEAAFSAVEIQQWQIHQIEEGLPEARRQRLRERRGGGGSLRQMDGEAYLIMSSGKQLFPEDRLDVWYDGSAICVIAVGTHGDPLDLGEDEVRAPSSRSCTPAWSRLRTRMKVHPPLRRFRQLPRNHLGKVLVCSPQRKE
jgi:hypothetical protein